MANARPWMAGQGDPEPACLRHGWQRQISHMNDVEQMSSTPTPSFPRKREPSVFGAGFRRPRSAIHWVDQLTLLTCHYAFAGMPVAGILAMQILLSWAPAHTTQVTGHPTLL